MLHRAWLVGVAGACAACSSTPLKPAPSADAGSTPVAPQTRSIDVFDAARISSDESATNFQRIAADVDFSGGPYQSATLIADLSTTCYPFSGWASDPPPLGQNFPADCDAFDRNFELALDEPEADASATPGLELVRAITPFGGPMHVQRDITAVVNALPGSHRLSARINTYSDGAGMISGANGGWNVSLRVELVSGPPPQHALAVVPLFYGDMTSADSASASFTTPPGTRSAYIEYRTTGHGQAAADPFECTGPAEEFCQRKHTITLDGATLDTFTPWRSCTDACTLTSDSDAGPQYCAQNPCGDITSVKAARANWCPGAETPPRILAGPGFAAPGMHDISWQIEQVAAGGVVRVSLTYYAFAD